MGWDVELLRSSSSSSGSGSISSSSSSSNLSSNSSSSSSSSSNSSSVRRSIRRSLVTLGPFLFAGWPGSETRCPPATGEEALEEAPGQSWEVEAAGVPGAAGREDSPGRKGCTSNPWRSEPGPWLCTTLFPSDRTASRSTGLCSSSARTMW
ncbi:putative protein TPRXL isoform X2 [Dromiciops gliroides]|uniref:putative protein TPRXL isoform X2 n=1 Tax=Dromiciops gliroides TaxID=33562 RepID=UPI001CC42830|nr:putative protein TPRXL isoform X2 [Dromiciops gliroides]